MGRERGNFRTRGLVGIATLSLAAGALGLVASSAGGLTPPPTDVIQEKVTICHRTNSNTNPYVVNTPNASGDVSGHAGHTGPVWNDTLKAQKIKWGDIIPPFKYGPNVEDFFVGLNWDDDGQAFYKADCETPPPVEQSFGSLVVTKTVVLPTGTPAAALPTSFTVHVECDDLVTSVDVTFPATGGAGTPAKIDNIEAGSTCVVTEKDVTTFPAGTKVTYTPTGADVEGVGVLVDADTTVTVGVTNNFASIEVKAEAVQAVAAEPVAVQPAFTG